MPQRPQFMLLKHFGLHRCVPKHQTTYSDKSCGCGIACFGNGDPSSVLLCALHKGKGKNSVVPQLGHFAAVRRPKSPKPEWCPDLDLEFHKLLSEVSANSLELGVPCTTVSCVLAEQLRKGHVDAGGEFG